MARRAEIRAALRSWAAFARCRRSSSPRRSAVDPAFANAAALVDSPLDPPAMLARLKAIERAFGRRRGQRWARG
jgi:2-amino-4-hydroxy-6-hydroxymethyldihydropteridine diphosphokinase